MVNAPKEQSWFEMLEIRQQTIVNDTWIPLCALQTLLKEGKWGHEGYIEECYHVGSVMFDVSLHDKVKNIKQSDIITSDYDGGKAFKSCHQDKHFDEQGKSISKWVPKFFCRRNKTLSDEGEIPETLLWTGEHDFHNGHLGTGLVIRQHFERLGKTEQHLHTEWHLHQDFVIALGLMREGDVWVRPQEECIEVARLKRDNSREPVQLDVRAEHLRDYLKARNMNLYIASYRSREEICNSAKHISWQSTKKDESIELQRWEGNTWPTHEGIGLPYHTRTDVDFDEDVPQFDLASNDNIVSQIGVKKVKERVLYKIAGELWRTEVIEPAQFSERVLRDHIPSNVEFIINASGQRETGNKLEHRSWLWFRPQIVMTILSTYRATLHWHTRNTGWIGLLSGTGVTFGINSLGFINVYAIDIGRLPIWLQRIWSAANITPEGGVSEELLMSQKQATPASTKAPEARLHNVFEAVNTKFQSCTEKPLFKAHQITDTLFEKCHRFRALDHPGLFELAKDLARLTVERIDGDMLNTICQPPKGLKAGSIKHLEKVLSKFAPGEEAKKITGVFVGINELRQADAHLPSAHLQKSIQLVGIAEPDMTGSGMTMDGARQMLDALVNSLERISQISLDNPCN